MNALSAILRILFNCIILSLLHGIEEVETNRKQWYNQLTTYNVSSLSNIAIAQRAYVVIANPEDCRRDDPSDNDGGSKTDEDDILFLVIFLYQVETCNQ